MLTVNTSLKAFRSRAMPSALYPGEFLTLQSWRDPKQLQQNRPKSTTAESRLWGEDTLTSAILYGEQGRSKTRPQPTPTTSNSSSQQFLPRDQPKDIRRSDSRITTANGRTSNSTRMPKRQAEKPLERHRSQRRRQELVRNSDLKDERYIRSTTTVPTLENYPHLSPLIFKSPKGDIHNALQGNADLQSSISQIGSRHAPAFRCQLSYENYMTGNSETVTGEGTSKVR